MDARRLAFQLFDHGRSVDDVVTATGRARSTIVGYLEDYVAERKPASVEPWVPAEVYRRVAAAAAKVGGSFLRPVYDALGGVTSYDDIRIVMRHAGLR